ncbi:flavin reductase [Streptomyces sp. WAC05374]|uniref:flavin reductase family protein n=1 Tax=Streptomyces sp. WAC05374 TaxID=2487420 RepID=UPI000F867266|nr:flavin reductase family protein [Streptomyces sp. WAC05374]RST15903.1 flavin reductase [Streptomyces sp. WAC05374]TDF54529.1 flavin reductase [Streptomyces sp. WAC05374]TDF56164.1 flavin reductase [Streptomyces sp. WAC05374]
MAGLDAFSDLLNYPMYVVTAASGDERAGCLVGFASQCSIDPPRFAVWLSTANRTYRVARHSTHLAVHLLDRGQGDLARLFGGATGDETDKFARVPWRPHEGGVPVLTDARAWFVGRVLDRIDGGDHRGFLLDPLETSPPVPGRPPLIMFGDVADLEPGHPA